MKTTKHTIKSLIIKAATAALFLLIILAFSGCSPEQIAAWKRASADATALAVMVSDEITELEIELAGLDLSDPVEQQQAQYIATKLGELRESWDEQAAKVAEMNDKIQEAESGFAIFEAVLGAVGVAIPGIPIVTVFLRRWKKAFETVVISGRGWWA